MSITLPSRLELAEHSWMEQASCINEDPDLFWLDPERDDHEIREMKAEAARAICSDCPVRAQCLLWGLLVADQDHWSILGGTTHRQRKWIRREIGWTK